MLLVEDRGPVRWLTLNRPERKNAVPPSGWDSLREAFIEFGKADARVLVIRGSGEDFCSGADLSGPPSATEVTAWERQMQRVHQAALALHRLSKPTVAAVDGVAVGAGMNLALGCDLAIATNRARFSEIFVRRGLTLDFGGSWLLPRAVGLQRARELALTGRMVEADEAVRIGLALEAVEPGRLVERAAELANLLAAGAPVAQMLTKQGLNRSWELSFERALAVESRSQAICLSSDDSKEGAAAFLERRSPQFRGR